MRFSLQDFEMWLRERGYDLMMGEENFRMFLELGFASLLFYNSNLLFSFIASKLFGLAESERLDGRIRFEIARRVRSIKATKYEIEVEVNKSKN